MLLLFLIHITDNIGNIFYLCIIILLLFHTILCTFNVVKHNK